MTIDIIDLTSPEYDSLTAVQLSMVRVAQGKKNKIMAEAERDKEELRRTLIANNFARSTISQYTNTRIDEEAEAQVEVIREDLMHQIAYEALGTEGNEQGPYRYPENPNYNLAPAQRFLVVRSYYMEATTDPVARLEAYTMDTLARQYLGDFYLSLYDLLASYCN